MKKKWDNKVLLSWRSISCSVVSNPLQPHELQHARLLCPRGFPGKNTGVDCHFLLHGWSQPRDLTQVSCIAVRFFTIWGTREVLTLSDEQKKKEKYKTYAGYFICFFQSRKFFYSLPILKLKTKGIKICLAFTSISYYQNQKITTIFKYCEGKEWNAGVSCPAKMWLLCQMSQGCVALRSVLKQTDRRHKGESKMTESREKLS